MPLGVEGVDDYKQVVKAKTNQKDSIVSFKKLSEMLLYYVKISLFYPIQMPLDTTIFLLTCYMISCLSSSPDNCGTTTT